MRDASRAQPTGGWLLGVGVRVEAWNDPAWPTREDLDRATGARPACVMSFDHHAVLANSAAMLAAGLSDRSSDPAGGVIVRDANGVPTGLLLESAAWQVWNAAPEPPDHERETHVLKALADLHRHGFNEVHDLKAPLWLGPLLATLRQRGAPIMRVALYPMLEDIEAAVQGAPSWEGAGLELRGAKVFADGTLNSATAWMLQPYASPLEGHPCGKPLMTREELLLAMERVAAASRGRDTPLELAVHAIGDGAVRAVLDARERFLATRDRSHPRGAPGLRIEHAEIVDERDIKRFAALDVVASVQPCHLLTDIEVLERQLPHRLSRVLPLRELIDSGLRPGQGLLFGSDVPIVRADPRDSILAATQRGRGDGKTIAGEQAISEAEAWDAFGANV